MIAIGQCIEVDTSTGKMKNPIKKYDNSFHNSNKNVEVDDLDVTDAEGHTDAKTVSKCKNTKGDNPIKLDNQNYNFYPNPEDSTSTPPCVPDSPEDVDEDVENVDTQVEVFNPNSPPKSDVKNTAVHRNVKHPSRPFYNVFYNVFPGQTQTVYQPIITPVPVPASPLIFIILGATNSANQPLDIISHILSNIHTPNVIHYNHQIPQNNNNNYIRPIRNLISDSNNINYAKRVQILSGNALNKNIIPVGF